MKIGRNEKCSCGSGKKYKKCCAHKKLIHPTYLTRQKDIGQLIHDAGMMALEHDKASVEQSIKILNGILTDNNLSNEHQINAKLSLSVAYRHLGEHKNAINILGELNENYNNNNELSEAIHFSLAISYNSLGYHEDSCHIFNSILDGWNNVKCKSAQEKRQRGIYFIEAGKAFSSNGENDKAIECWNKSIELLKEFEDSEAEHLGRAKANIACSKLRSGKEHIQLEGVMEVEESSRNKLLIGDIQGLANNYCNLGSYFITKKRYERAIAYYRKDLFLSKLVGNKREIASTLGNLALIYAELKQFKQARDMLRQADFIANELTDETLHEICKRQLEHINLAAKQCGINKISMGEKAECGCGSKKLYIECCGLADFEPISIPQIYGGVSEDAKKNP
ncbi:YecA family protein [Aeromonas allosaccharophila]|uniref:YecA family protein n=1 Tax=Aeromonas allosaccharophila TaxID=656 RepID=UPI002AE08C11|nr:tetratricopeptide repeat protein [Aeromonas allosaccharophila]